MQCATSLQHYHFLPQIPFIIFYDFLTFFPAFCADGLNQIKGLKVNMASVETNIVSTTDLDSLISF